VKEKRTGRCRARVFFVSISRRARARRSSSFARTHCFHECHPLGCSGSPDKLRMDPASLPPRRDLLGLEPSPALSSTWQWIAFPRDPTGALRARRHSCSDPGELGHLPAGLTSRRTFVPGRTARWLWLPGARGSGPAATPVLSTDVCCSRMLFSKTIAHVSAHVASLFPHDARARGSTPQCPLRRTDRSALRELSSPNVIPTAYL
jgi:hypothetical protein